MDTTVAIIFFGFLAAVALFWVGLYYVDAYPILGEWWDKLTAAGAAQLARRREANAARLREQQVGIETPFTPAAVVDRAVEQMTREGWSLQSRSDTTASFARDQGADACAGCLLMLLFIVPGILYLALANRTVRVTLAAYPHEGGSRLVIGGDDGQAIGRLIKWARSLRYETPPSQLPAPEAGGSPSAPNLSERLRELADLRDSGLITEEEFEAKKKDLLDRM